MRNTFSIRPEPFAFLGESPGISQEYGVQPRIQDRTHLTPKSQRKAHRDPSTVYALVLHQMAFSRGNASRKYDTVTSHYAILPDGQILQLHPISAYLWASNGFNRRSVAVEFAGNFPNTKGKCWEAGKFGCHSLTQAQIDAGRFLVGHLIKEIGLTHILAHRQSSGTRTNDPGPEIWYEIGQWAIENLGLKDGGAGFFIDSGKPIPQEWRNWGRRAPVRETSLLLPETIRGGHEWEEDFKIGPRADVSHSFSSQEEGIEPFELAIESGEWKSDGLSKTSEMEFAEGAQRIKISRTRQDYIRWVQQSLNKIMGLNLRADGIMGPQTRSAIRSFQQKQGLVADGIVRPNTEAAIIKAGGGAPPGKVITPPTTDIIRPAAARLTRFDKNSAKLKDFHAREIDRTAEQIEASWRTGLPIVTVYVKGHTSSEGPAQYNIGLGNHRALAVRKALQKALERKQKNLSYKVLILTLSKGAKDPIAPNATEEGRSENRRVEVFLSTKALMPLPQKQPVQQPLPGMKDIPWIYPDLPRPTLPTDDEECKRELERRLRDCNKNYARCLGEKGFNVIVERLKRLAPTGPGCLAAIESGNVWKILHCAYKVGVIDIDTFFNTKKAIDDCARTLGLCRHLAKVNVRCP
ncbi:MAG: OmpA family protein [Nitrospira sp. CR2.1]|nr:OmpA family protein [Nitrospira sp. CR2.1]